MTIRHLKIFIVVAECGKMNVAAKELYVSQPSISQAIAELEKYYNVKLFERLSKRLYITESGEKLLPYARHIVDSFETMDNVMKKEGEYPKLRIGASVSVGTCMLNPLLEKMEEEQEKIESKVVVNNTAVIETMIENSLLDIGIVEGNVCSKDLIQLPVCQDELVIVVGKKHPFYTKNEIELQELDGMGLIAREDGSQVRNQFEQMLIEKNITLNMRWSCTNTEAIKNVVANSKDIAIMSRMLIEREEKEGILRAVFIKDTRVHREIKVIYHKNKYKGKAMLYFLECVKEFL